MIVRARDVATNASDLAEITVTIDDINDNTPRFLTIPAQHVFSVLENTMDKFVGRIRAEDRDAGENGAITYSIESQTPRTHFSVNPGTGSITVSGDLDREMFSNYSLTIKATDNADVPRTATTQATIHIMDVNDNPPTFTETSYAVAVKEDSAMSTQVIDAHAVDHWTRQ
ncbi:cadherin EGF LAG seven-pass G-type receptor 2-like [Haliotis rubra]|uniref:cadherin EGF LAG seven-pass G-type receptor 2-like n=1 Tax=Haliotis rubra TaxID=36100 RepID=UPI001EE60C4B|nr:cadherin EGF LAG seven-pass G-type receptor 2-like [Haliotis rubra]